MSEYQPSSYTMKEKGKGKLGLYFQPPAKKQTNDELEAPAPLWICDPFEITARSRDMDSGNHGLVLEWQDPDVVPHQWLMPFELLAGDGVEIRKVLLHGGLRIATKKYAKEHLLSYLNEAMPRRTARSVFAIGWHAGVYVMPQQTIGA